MISERDNGMKNSTKERYLKLCNTMSRGENSGRSDFLCDDIIDILENNSFEDSLIKRNIILGVSTFGRESLKEAISSILRQKDSDGNLLNINIIISAPFTADTNKIKNYISSINNINIKNISIISTRDYGPITKLMGALHAAKSDNDIILLADDDVIYPELHFYNLIKNFLYLNENFAVACSGFNWKGMIKNYDNNLMPYESYINAEGHFELISIIETWCGVCLRASWFNKSFKDFVSSFCFVVPDLFRQDDMIYSCYLDLQGIRKININTDFCNRYDTGFSEITQKLCENNSIKASLNGEDGEHMNWIRVAEYIVATQNYIFDFCETKKTEQRIAVATVSIGEDYTNQMWPGMISKAAYCDKHGYKFIVQTQSLDNKRPLIWSKLILIRDLLLEGYDYVLYTDADSVITNKNIKIESLFSTYNKSLLVTKDVNGINIGNMLVKRCEASIYFIDQCLSQEGFYYKAPWYEQAAFVYLMNKFPSFASEHIAITPKRLFNSYVNDWHQNDFIVHLAGIYGARVRGLMNSVYSISISKTPVGPTSDYNNIRPYFEDYKSDPDASTHLIPNDVSAISDFDLYREINKTHISGRVLLLIGNDIDFILAILKDYSNLFVVNEENYNELSDILSFSTGDNLIVLVFFKLERSLRELKNLILERHKRLLIAIIGSYADKYLFNAYSQIINNDYYKNVSIFIRREDMLLNPAHALYQLGDFAGLKGLCQIAKKFYKNQNNICFPQDYRSSFGYNSFTACWRSPKQFDWHKPFGLASLPSTEVR